MNNVQEYARAYKAGLTEDELRDRVLETNKPLAFGQGQWREFDRERGVWIQLRGEAVGQRVVTTLEAAKPEGVRPSKRLAESVMGLIKYKCFIPDETWDADPDILICRNGALSVKTGKLSAHSESHYATSGVPYSYDPGAKAPAWSRFMARVFESDVAGFLQQFAGYCLTVDTSHELAVWLHSPPGGGKSTFIAGVKTMLGERAGELGLGQLASNPRFALANLPGKTLLTAAEQPSGAIRCAHNLNSIISGDVIQIEQKYKDPVDITPRAKILWAMNELPNIYDPSNGLFRRLAIIEMKEIPEEKRDPEVRCTIEREGPGILNWALDGLAKLKERGKFHLPDSIRDARARFKEESDVPLLFLKEMCEYDPARKDAPGMRAGSRALYDEYRRYCERTGHKPKAENRIGKDWERLGLEKITPGGKRFWKGVRTGIKERD